MTMDKAVRKRGRFGLSAVFVVSALALGSCVFEQPVFESGLARPAHLDGLWQTTDANGDVQHAALFPLGEQTSLLQYPLATNGWWFEARSLRINDRDLLQLRVLAGPGSQPAEKGGNNYTLAWLETLADGTVRMRALDGASIGKAGLTAASLRDVLSDPQGDWDKFFGAASIFHHSAKTQ